MWVRGVVKGLCADVPSLDGGHVVVEEEGEDGGGGVKSWEEEGVLPVARCGWEGGVGRVDDSEGGGMESQLVEGRGEVEEDMVGFGHAEFVFVVVEEIIEARGSNGGARGIREEFERVWVIVVGACGLFDGVMGELGEPVARGEEGEVGGGSSSGREGEWGKGVCTRGVVSG